MAASGTAFLVSPLHHLRTRQVCPEDGVHLTTCGHREATKKDTRKWEMDVKTQLLKTHRMWTAAIKLARVIVIALAAFEVQAQGAFRSASKWSDWMCVRQEVCAVGDFNGDGRDDIVAFVRNTQTGAGQGDVWVALSTGPSVGTRFGPAEKWSEEFCIGQEVCAVGDFNGDGRDDIVAFLRNTQTGAGQGDIWVALSTGTSFRLAQIWSNSFCIGQEVCAVGDFDGDGRDDIVAFVRDTQTGIGRGDVLVARSTGYSFETSRKWSDWMCVRQEVCAVGDFNGDGRDDIVAFVRNTPTGAGQGDVWVALSTGPFFPVGTMFGPAEKWSEEFCIGQEVCAVGYFYGRSFSADIVAFMGDTRTGIGRGDVWVALKEGLLKFGFTLPAKWSDWMCVRQEVCAVGDFDGNGRDDVIAFVRDTQLGAGRGDVWVALSR